MSTKAHHRAEHLVQIVPTDTPGFSRLMLGHTTLRLTESAQAEARRAAIVGEIVRLLDAFRAPLAEALRHQIEAILKPLATEIQIIESENDSDLFVALSTTDWDDISGIAPGAITATAPTPGGAVASLVSAYRRALDLNNAPVPEAP